RAERSHRPQLDEETSRQELAEGEEYVQRADHVIYLREDRVLAVNHRIGSGPLFREMNNRVRFEGLERGSQKLVIGNVSDEQLDGLACEIGRASCRERV